MFKSAASSKSKYMSQSVCSGIKQEQTTQSTQATSLAESSEGIYSDSQSIQSSPTQSSQAQNRGRFFWIQHRSLQFKADSTPSIIDYKCYHTELRLETQHKGILLWQLRSPSSIQQQAYSAIEVTYEHKISWLHQNSAFNVHAIFFSLWFTLSLFSAI